jgi:hypothetical protein
MLMLNATTIGAHNVASVQDMIVILLKDIVESELSTGLLAADDSDIADFVRPTTESSDPRVSMLIFFLVLNMIIRTPPPTMHAGTMMFRIVRVNRIDMTLSKLSLPSATFSSIKFSIERSRKEIFSPGSSRGAKSFWDSLVMRGRLVRYLEKVPQRLTYSCPT